jgi:hypothetical protein
MSKPPFFGSTAKDRRGRLFATYQLPVHPEGQLSSDDNDPSTTKPVCFASR